MRPPAGSVRIVQRFYVDVLNCAVVGSENVDLICLESIFASKSTIYLRMRLLRIHTYTFEARV